MGNTTFFQEAKNGSGKVIWKDLFSESFKKHSAAERAYALSVGTPLNQPTEGNMLKKWHKPWLWFSAAKFGLAFFVVTFALMILMPMLGFRTAGIDMFYLVVLPMIVPLIVMVFLWELNVPQNISVWELMAFFLVGGLLSFVFTNPFLDLVPDSYPASYAAIQEEPPKLLAGIVLLMYLDKKTDKKIYGMTGLVIGAAVGTGFAALESVLYSISSGGGTILIRALVAAGGHMVYAAPYTAAYAHALREKKSYIGALLDKDVLIALAISIGFHGLWNSSFNQGYFTMALFVVLKWVNLFYWMRKYLVEVIEIAQNAAYLQPEPQVSVPVPNGRARQLCATVTCLEGGAKGQQWNCVTTPLVIGRDPSCGIPLPGNPKGVSRCHCEILPTGNGFLLRDLNSTYGTYISSGRLPAGSEFALTEGERIYLGSKSQAFVVHISESL